METRLTIQEKQRVEDLFSRIANLIETSRARVVTAVNVAEVYTKYEIGRYIIEDEQGGSIRAQYGKKVLKELSQKLTRRFGDGWSVENLKLFRRFYLVYSNSVTSGYPIQDKIGNQRLPKSHSNVITAPSSPKISERPSFTLSWSHYVILMRVENPDARRFYEIECAQQQWSKRQLSRQVGSSLYERLALSRDKEVECVKVEYEAPDVIQERIETLESEITATFIEFSNKFILRYG